MCGRFVRAKQPEEYGEAFEVAQVPDLPSYNIAPTQNVITIRVQEDARACVVLRWGLVPSWARESKTSYINARAETLLEKASFRNSFQRRRCLVLADGYYEWKAGGKVKQPYYFRPVDEGPIAFAGIWDRWQGPEEPLEACAIITTGANELSATVHDRMPVILRGAAALDWIHAEPADAKRLLELLQPFPAADMVGHAVQTLVNSPKNNSPRCIEPIA